MDCFLDFCLACDKQTLDGLYCSQACRLADLEKAGTSAPTSPSAPNSVDHRTPGFFSLPPGFDFGASKANATKAPDSPVLHPRQTSPLEFKRERVLSPSTSRSSLASAVSNISPQAGAVMSEQAQHELQGYVSSFDAIREMKRRSLSGTTGH